MPSRKKKSRDASPGSIEQYRADVAVTEHGEPAGAAVGIPSSGAVASSAGAAVSGQGVSGQGVSGQGVSGQGVSGQGVGGQGVGGQGGGGQGGGQAVAPAEKAQGRPPGRVLRNWRVRSRLVLLIAIPTATAVALGGTSIVSSWRSAAAYQRTETLAVLSTKITQAAFDVEAERDAIVSYIAGGNEGRAGVISHGRAWQIKNPTKFQTAKGQLDVANEEIAFTRPAVKAVDAGVAQIGSGYTTAVQEHAGSVASELSTLPGLRRLALKSDIPANELITEYETVINSLLAFDDQVAASSSDPQLVSTARAMAAVSRLEDQDSIERAIVMYGLTAGKMDANLFTQLTSSQAEYGADDAEFKNFATAGQQNVFQNYLAKSLEDRVINDVSEVVSSHNSLATLPIVPTDWYGAISNAIIGVHNFEEYLATSAVSRAKELRKRAIADAIVVGSLILFVLILSLLFTVFVGRSMVRPLRRLRAGALEVAGISLPDAVRRMSDTDGENVSIEVEPIDVDSSDEIGEVARAFDQVHREALRLAATEAALRGNVNAMFVNLSRRSQSLVERQIRLIDELEQGEQDSERLGSLFQMDHLATRMRRNSENLLVLAGHESSRRWNQPVPLVDVLRAAISEIEQYERVMLNVQPGIAVRGPAVNDVVHLIAELAENATSFSSADTPVSVSGHLLGSGGVLLDITDEGVGMGSDEMAHANWRLDNPPVVDVAVSRRMGLFVVARLAARHGIRVRLRPATGNGLTALVWLPDEVIVNEGQSGAVEPGRLPERSGRFALEPGNMSGQASGEWSQPGAVSAYDEVAAARARFSPEMPDGNGDYGLSVFDSRPGMGSDPGFSSQPGFASDPGFGSQPGFGQTGFADRDQQFASGQFISSHFSDRPFGDQMLSGPGFGERGSSESGTAELTGSEGSAVTDSGNLDLGPQRVPGAGPHPGQFATGPIPAIDAGPPQALEHPEWFAAAGRRPELGDQGQPVGADGHEQAPAQADGQATQERATWGDGQTEQYAQPVFGAPVAQALPLSGTFRTDSQFGTAAGGVIVPPPASLGEENRLPIFEAVESDWFRRGRPSVDLPSGQDDGVSSPGWSSLADEGWRAAEVAVAPSSGGTTVAGLPRRVPQANLIPGTAADVPAPAPVARSASATRERFASLQRGMREGRAATGIDSSEGTGEVPGDG